MLGVAILKNEEVLYVLMWNNLCTGYLLPP